MRNHRLAVICAALAAASAATMIIVSCTGDDGFLYPDAGGADVSQPPRDVAQIDSQVPPVDGSVDARDAVADARDAGDAADASDAADAADSHVVTPDASTILTHAQREIESLCQFTKGCCAAAGQATFDLAKCRNLYQGYGFQGDLLNVRDDVLRAGNVLIDTSRGAQCYNAISTLTCKNISSAAYSSARGHCFETLRGTLAANANCRSTIECQPGLFCESFSDGGVFPSDAGDAGDASVAPIVGRCVAVKAVGAACGADEECSHRANGNACDMTTGLCVGPLANNADCRQSGQCTSQICTGTCVPVVTDYITAGECADFQ